MTRMHFGYLFFFTSLDGAATCISCWKSFDFGAIRSDTPPFFKIHDGSWNITKTDMELIYSIAHRSKKPE